MVYISTKFSRCWCLVAMTTRSRYGKSDDSGYLFSYPFLKYWILWSNFLSDDIFRHFPLRLHVQLEFYISFIRCSVNLSGLELQASTLFIHTSRSFGLYSDGTHSRSLTFHKQGWKLPILSFLMFFLFGYYILMLTLFCLLLADEFILNINPHSPSLVIILHLSPFCLDLNRFSFITNIPGL